MHIIKLSATPSTNSYLKRLVLESNLDDFTVVVCSHQSQGRGQKGNSWVSANGKNLTVSILKKFNALEATWSFNLNCLVSLAIYDVLNELSIPDIKVKWPNDIMSGNRKLCGILIENTLKGRFIKHSIIGFGLNVNQTHFDDLPHATSLKLETGVDYNLELLLVLVVERVKHYLGDSPMNNFKSIKQKYEESMFRRGQSADFALADGPRFRGTIVGITDTGLLAMEKEDGKLVNFNFKEVKYLL